MNDWIGLLVAAVGAAAIVIGAVNMNAHRSGARVLVAVGILLALIGATLEILAILRG